jgi:hypothetical protein
MGNREWMVVVKTVGGVVRDASRGRVGLACLLCWVAIMSTSERVRYGSLIVIFM